MFVYLCLLVSIRKVNKFHKTLPKVIEYGESEYHTFEFVKCEFNVVYINIHIVNKR